MAKSKKEATVVILSKMPDDPHIIMRLHRAEQDVLGYGYAVQKHYRGTFCQHPQCDGYNTTGLGFCEEHRDSHVKALYYYSVSKLSTSLMEDNGQQYIIDDDSCTCPDFEKAPGNLCKHRLAVMIIEEMERS